MVKNTRNVHKGEKRHLTDEKKANNCENNKTSAQRKKQQSAEARKRRKQGEKVVEKPLKKELNTIIKQMSAGYGRTLPLSQALTSTIFGKNMVTHWCNGMLRLWQPASLTFH